MTILNELLPQLPDGKVIEAVVGIFWTAVVVEADGKRSCGLASTLHTGEHEHRHPAVADAGRLERSPACQLAALVNSESNPEVSIGLAAINALLPRPQSCVDRPAEEYIARQGPGSRVALIGHFPFIERLRPQVRDLWVLELNPKDGDLPASAEAEIIPQADILAITSTTLINHTFDEIFALRKPGAKVMLLGPTTPLAPHLLELGIDVLAGSIVDDPDVVLPFVRQGASFQQIKRAGGVRLVTLEKNE